MNNRFRGVSTSTATISGNAAQAAKPPKAKIAQNQEAIDRLFEMSQKVGKSNFTYTLSRAIKSVKECSEAITTLEQALALKYVGDRLAAVIVPHRPGSSLSQRSRPPKRPIPPPSTAATAGTATATQPQPIKKTRQTTLTHNLGINKEKPAFVSSKEKAYQKAREHAEQLVLPKGPWKLLLLVDIREHKSQSVVAKCKQSGIPCEERHLPIGDMAWVARCGRDGTEVMAGTILERKEVNDLAGSIYGTRFLEQRLRLLHSGIPQLLYLVEGDLDSVANCPADTLRMAMMETRVQMGFGVLKTKHLDDSVKVLKSLHRRIIQRTFPNNAKLEHLPTFSGTIRGLHGRKQRRPASLLEMEFDSPPVPPLGQERFITYAELKAKVERDREAGRRTVGAVYTAMLKQVNSLSLKKCQAISATYPTWNHLMQAYQQVVTPTNVHQNAPREGSEKDTDDATVANPPTVTTPYHKTKTALLVKDILINGNVKIGQKSAQELDIVCCTQEDGQLMTVKQGATIPPPPPPAATVTAQQQQAMEISTSTSAASTMPSMTQQGRQKVSSLPVTAAAASCNNTRTVATSTAPGHVLDLTDSPQLPRRETTAPSFLVAYEPARNDDFSSSDEDLDDQEHVQRVESLRQKCSNSATKPVASSLASFSSSDDDDGYNVSDMIRKRKAAPTSSMEQRAVKKPPAVLDFSFSGDDEDDSPERPTKTFRARQEQGEASRNVSSDDGKSATTSTRNEPSGVLELLFSSDDEENSPISQKPRAVERRQVFARKISEEGSSNTGSTNATASMVAKKPDTLDLSFSSDDDDKSLMAMSSMKQRSVEMSISSKPVASNNTSSATTALSCLHETAAHRPQGLCTPLQSATHMAARRSRESLSGESPVWFSSPSSTTSDDISRHVDAASPGLSNVPKHHNRRASTPLSTRPARDQNDDSVIVIDDLSDIELVPQSAQVAAATRQVEDDDLRSRLAKRLGRETIVLDD